MSRLPGYEGCLFCGPEHPEGLHLQMYYRDGTVVADLSVRNFFQGYGNLVHGGIIAGLLDEVMWWAVTLQTRQLSMTRKAETEYLHAVRCEMPYTVKGRLLEAKHNTFFAAAAIEDPSGRAVSRGSSVFRPVKTISIAEFQKKLDLTRVSPDMRGIFCSLLE